MAKFSGSMRKEDEGLARTSKLHHTVDARSIPPIRLDAQPQPGVQLRQKLARSEVSVKASCS